LEPLTALLVVALAEFGGLFLFGRRVADTLGGQMLHVPVGAGHTVVLAVLLAAVCGALLWNSIMWRMALPTSSSHALVGGLVGAFAVAYGPAGVEWPVFVRIFLLLGIVPIAGCFVGFLLTRLSYWVGEFMTPAVSPLFNALQVMALAGIALAHGSNDGQKSLGIMGLAYGMLAGASSVPWPRYFYPLAAGALAVGVLIGSRRLIHKMGRQLYRVQELQSFASQTATLTLVGASCLAGAPMSTTQVLSTSVLGSGAAVHPRGVRWDLAGGIGLVWICTIPAAAAVAGLLVLTVRILLHVVS
jgi:PiT family inorganic phosphate transporter